MNLLVDRQGARPFNDSLHVSKDRGIVHANLHTTAVVDSQDPRMVQIELGVLGDGCADPGSGDGFSEYCVDQGALTNTRLAEDGRIEPTIFSEADS